MNQKFKGMYAVAVTCFNEDGSFDMENSKKHLDYLIDSGIDGICVMGATGEYQSVSLEEHMAYVSEIIPYIGDRVPTFVGVSRERPEDVVLLMNAAEKAGTGAAMVLAPFYCHPTQEEVIAHFTYIAENTNLPIILYNNPGSAGIDLERDTMKALMEIPAVQVLKESTGSIQRLTEAVIDAPDHVSVFCGCDNMALESFMMGAVGMICMAANFAPKDCTALLAAVNAGEIQKAKEIYVRLLPAFEMLESVGKPGATIKYILKKYRGQNSGHMRRPRMDLTAEEQAQVDAVMDFTTIE